MIRYVIAAILLLVAVLGIPSRKTAQVDVPTPPVDMQEVIKPLLPVVAKMSVIDRFWMQEAYTNAARIVRADRTVAEPAITTTGKARAVHVTVLDFVWRGLAGNQPGKYPDMSAAIESAFVSVVGDKERIMTPELSEKLAALFDAIAWAGLGKDG